MKNIAIVASILIVLATLISAMALDVVDTPDFTQSDSEDFDLEASVNTTALDSLNTDVVSIMVAIIPIFIILGIFTRITKTTDDAASGKKSR